MANGDEILCRKCKANMPRTGFELSENNPAHQSFWGRIPIAFAASAYHYRKGEILPKLIHYLKYRKRKDIGLLLGKLTGKIITGSPHFRNPDYIIPVPLHPKKLKARGFNQCEILSEGITRETNIPVLKDVLVRETYNPSQTRKGRFERWQNVEGIFTVSDPGLLVNKHIILVDDVITTGSTIEACCLPLINIPGIIISVITIGFSNR